MINICPIGRNCTQSERDAFGLYDQEHHIREKMVATLEKEFPDYNFVYLIGGQISFDVVPKGWDKTYCLQQKASQLLPVKLSDAEVDELFALVKANPGIHFDVDLEAQEVKAGEKTYRFTIDAFRRHCMMNGLDSIGLTLQHDDAIAAYEAKQPAFMN